MEFEENMESWFQRCMILFSALIVASQTHWPIPGKGTGMKNSIPNFWEREQEWEIAFPTFENGNGSKNPFPTFGNRNGRQVFPGMVGNGNSRSSLCRRPRWIPCGRWKHVDFHMAVRGIWHQTRNGFTIFFAGTDQVQNKCIACLLNLVRFPNSQEGQGTWLVKPKWYQELYYRRLLCHLEIYCWQEV